jgi:filamentous hemagglutinin
MLLGRFGTRCGVGNSWIPGQWVELERPAKRFIEEWNGVTRVASSSERTGSSVRGSNLQWVPGETLRPNVVNTKLRNIVTDLYKGTNAARPIGTGSTMDAVRNALRTGIPTGGTFHSIKAGQYTSALRNWLANNPTASPHDRLVAQTLLDDLVGALRGQ